MRNCRKHIGLSTFHAFPHSATRAVSCGRKFEDVIFSQKIFTSFEVKNVLGEN